VLLVLAPHAGCVGIDLVAGRVVLPGAGLVKPGWAGGLRLAGLIFGGV